MNKNDGFIGKILLIIVAIVLAKYFLHFDFIEWIRTSEAKRIIDPIVSLIKAIYTWLDNFVRNAVS